MPLLGYYSELGTSPNDGFFLKKKTPDALNNEGRGTRMLCLGHLLPCHQIIGLDFDNGTNYF